jgi:hypothetical protein
MLWLTLIKHQLADIQPDLVYLRHTAQDIEGFQTACKVIHWNENEAAQHMNWVI